MESKDIYDIKSYVTTSYDIQSVVLSSYSVDDVLLTERPNQSIAAVTIDKPVLEDLPVLDGGSWSMNLENEFKNELEQLWNRSGDMLKGFQDQAKNVFKDIDVKMEDIQDVLGKLILKAQTRKQGSSLISTFLAASRRQDFSTISKVFDTFANQAERFARLIVSERHDSTGSKLISEAAVGGVAGGSKFIAG
jgi:hypothetical protein